MYAEECAASPCFAINFTQPSSRRTSYEEFRKLNSKWQHKLGKASCCQTALGSLLVLDAAQLLDFSAADWHLSQYILHLDLVACATRRCPYSQLSWCLQDSWKR